MAGAECLNSQASPFVRLIETILGLTGAGPPRIVCAEGDGACSPLFAL